jgi:hypothetical protein
MAKEESDLMKKFKALKMTGAQVKAAATKQSKSGKPYSKKSGKEEKTSKEMEALIKKASIFAISSTGERVGTRIKGGVAVTAAPRGTVIKKGTARVRIARGAATHEREKQYTKAERKALYRAKKEREAEWKAKQEKERMKPYTKVTVYTESLIKPLEPSGKEASGIRQLNIAKQHAPLTTEAVETRVQRKVIIRKMTPTQKIKESARAEARKTRFIGAIKKEQEKEFYAKLKEVEARKAAREAAKLAAKKAEQTPEKKKERRTLMLARAKAYERRQLEKKLVEAKKKAETQAAKAAKPVQREINIMENEADMLAREQQYPRTGPPLSERKRFAPIIKKARKDFLDDTTDLSEDTAEREVSQAEDSIPTARSYKIAKTEEEKKAIPKVSLRTAINPRTGQPWLPEQYQGESEAVQEEMARQAYKQEKSKGFVGTNIMVVATDNMGNIKYDSEGNPIYESKHITGKDDEDVARKARLLYGQVGTTPDGRPAYRRTTGVAHVRNNTPTGPGISTGYNQQLVVHAQISTDDGGSFPEYGFSSASPGTNEEKEQQALISLKKRIAELHGVGSKSYTIASMESYYQTLYY